MTDEIRITRRIALPTMYEFYEIEWTLEAGARNLGTVFATIEERVEFIRNKMEKPSPEISPKKADEPFTPGQDLIDELHKAYLDPETVEFIKPNIIKLKRFLKDKELWNKYNGVFRDAGYTWIGAGKDSRWER